MRKKLIRFGATLLLVLVLGLWFVQSPILGDLVLDEIEDLAAEAGYTFEADSMRFNLFTLSTVIKGLRVSGPGLSARFDKIYVNANLALSAKHIALDELHAENGQIDVTEELFAGDTTAPAQPEAAMELPLIDIGILEIKDVAATFRDKTVPVDASLKQFQFDYREQRFNSGMTLPAAVVGDLKTPPLKLTLSGTSPHFLTYQDLNLNLDSDDGRLKLQVRGRVGDHFEPDFTFEGNLDPALAATFLPADQAAPLRGLAMVQLTGTLDENNLHAVLTSAYDSRALQQPSLQPITVPLKISADYAWRQADTPTEVALDFGTWGTAALNARLSDTDIKGTVRLDLTALDQILVDVDPVQHLQAETSFQLPKATPADAKATLRATLAGRDLHLNLDGAYDRGAARFTGAGRLSPQSRVTFSGDYQEVLRLDAAVALTGIQDLAPFVSLPPELCTQTINLDVRHLVVDPRADQVAYQIGELKAHALAVRYDEYWQDDLVLTLNGDQNRLRGNLRSVAGRQDQPLVVFQLQPEKQIWDQLTIALENLSVPADPYRLTAEFYADGAGPLINPNLNGTLALHIADGEATNLAKLSSLWQLEAQTLTLEQTALNSHDVKATGRTQVFLATLLEAEGDTPAELKWNTDLQVEGTVNEDFKAFTEQVLPQFSIHLHGDQDELQADLNLPQQLFALAETELPLATPDPAQLTVTPSSGELAGRLAELRVAGLKLHDLTLSLADGRFAADAKLSLDEFETLQTALADQWPAGLTLEPLAGNFSVTADSRFEDLDARFHLNGGTFYFHEEPVEFQPIAVRYNNSLRIEPTSLHFAGIDVTIPETDPMEQAELFVPLQIAVNETDRLAAYLNEDWPDYLDLFSFRSEVTLVGPLDGTPPHVAFRIAELDADLGGKKLHILDLIGHYDNGIYLDPGRIDMADIAFDVENRPDGFSLNALLTPNDFDLLIGGFAGQGTTRLTLDWINQPHQPKIKMAMEQVSGTLVYRQPWLVFSDLALEMETGPDWSFFLTRGVANLNGGTLTLDGEFLPLAVDGAQARIGIGTQDVELIEADYQIKLSNYLQWQYAPGVNQVNGTIKLDKAFLVPDLGLAGLIRDTLNSGEELYFPDPFLEDIKLTVVVQATQPIVVDTDLAFLELEAPAVVVGGNLAEPIVLEGQVFINEGSVVSLGNESIAFKDSQVQFNAARPNDPYLQLYMDYQTATGHTPINIISYAAELSQNLDGNNLAGLVSNFLVGQVSSLISLESQFNETLFNSSFTLVLSKPLARRVVTRYAFPLQEGASAQRFELQLGPKYDSYINFINQEDTLTTSLRHQRQFGYYQGKRPEIIRDRDFTPGNLPRWVRRKFRLNEEEEYTPTRWRHAEIDLRRRARERGYLNPDIRGEYANHRLEVIVDLGERIVIDLVKTGFAETEFKLTDEYRRQIMRRLGRDTETDKRMIGQLVERMAASEGYPSSFAKVAKSDTGFVVELFTSPKINDLGLTFGEATPLLEDLLKDRTWTNQFILEWLSSESSARDRLRAVLAARGHLLVDIGRGDFVDMQNYRIPVDPGPRAKLISVQKNGEPVKSNLIGRPFEYSFLARLAQELFPNKSASVKATAADSDIIINVIYYKPQQTEYEGLEITNDGRVNNRNLNRFVGYRNSISHKQLIDAQNRLNQTGAFRMVRLETQGNQAKLFLRERNRYTAGFEVNYDERNKAGYAIQFSDKMFLKRLDKWSLRAEHNNRVDDFITQIRFRRLWWLPVDFQLGGRLLDNKEAINTNIEDDDFFGQRRRTRQFEKITEATLEAIYTLTDHQEVSAGVRVRRSLLNDISEIFGPDDQGLPNSNPDNLLLRSENEFAIDALPINLTWVYRNLDNTAKPRNGLLLSLAAEHAIEGLGTDEAVEGTRWLGKMTRFHSWNRWLWTHRLESGIYRRTQDLEVSGGGSSGIDTVFFLGGSTTLRGFDQKFAGPIVKEESGELDEDGETFLVAPTFRGIGGDAMFFLSEELTYHTNWYWIEVAGFVDTGWVWDNYDQMFDFGPAVTGGLGLGIDSPIGYFRFDYALPIDDDALLRAIDSSSSISERDREFARDRAMQEFTFRFGRTF